MPDAGAAELTAAKAPSGLLIVAGLLAVAGIAVALVCWGWWPALVGWALAGPIAIGVAAVFSLRDTGRRAAPVYLSPSWLPVANIVVILAIVAGVIVSSVSIAFWVGKL